MKRGNVQHLSNPRATKRSKLQNSDETEDNVEYLKTVKNIIPEIFSQWRDFLDKDSFTDLRIICKNDCYSGGVSLHKAVLASCSSFLSDLLTDGRDETVLILPDIEKHDLISLVRILYGERFTFHRPSNELLHMLGISKLPSTTSTMPLLAEHFTLTSIQAEHCSDSSDDETDSSVEDPEPGLAHGATPACSVGVEGQRLAREGSEPRNEEDVDITDEPEHVDDGQVEEPEVTKKVVVKIALSKLSAKLISQLRGNESIQNESIETIQDISKEKESDEDMNVTNQDNRQSPIRTRSRTRSQTKSRLAKEATNPQTKFISGPARTARGRPLVRRFSRLSTSSLSSTESMSTTRSSSRNSTASSSSNSSSDRSSSNYSRGSSRRSSLSSVTSRHSSGARVWSPTESTTSKPPSLKSGNSKAGSTASESFRLALSESSDNGSDHEESNKIIEDEDTDEVFVNPSQVVTTATVTNKVPTENVLNTPAYVPATPGRDWCSDSGSFCPPESRRINKETKTVTNNPTNTELTNLGNTSTNITRTEITQPTPFQTPPPSVSYSSTTHTPEHPPFMTPSESDTSPSPMIQPPDLFKDDVISTKPMVIQDDFRTLDKSVVNDWLGQRAVLKVPESTQANWSDDDGGKGSDWSDAAWSEDDEPKPQSFSQLFNATRTIMTPRATPRMTPNTLMLPNMTPRSQEISQILDSLYNSPGMTV